jgi:UDP-2-acetamido-3-amino-2,3-dideoxy-glucuronate N-acetyltransferase
MTIGGCSVRRVCDLDTKAFARLELAGGGPGFTRDYREILGDEEIDAVVVASPSETHGPFGLEALRAGKHVFVEKPFALSSREARRMVSEARKRNRVLMVGHLLMYHPGVQALAKLVHKGAVGRVFFLGIRRRNLGRLQNDCSVLWALGPHDISIALMVTGKTPIKVVTTGQSYLQPGFPEVAFTTITFEGGVQAHIEESWLAPERERELVVVGEKGMLVLNELSSAPLKFFKKSVRLNRSTEIREFDYLDGGVDPVEVASEQPLEAECRHFIDCIRTGSEPESGGQNGLEVLRVLEAAERSLRKGGRVTPVAGRR